MTLSKTNYNANFKKWANNGWKPFNPRQFDNILDEDIIYRDTNISILNPHVKKGILIYTHFDIKNSSIDVCKIGLKSGKKLKEQGFNFGRSIAHPYIFFRAPFYASNIDYSSINSELISNYRNIPGKNHAFIRVDPRHTYTYSSEYRAKKMYHMINEYYINRSRKTLLNYLKIIYKYQDEDILNPIYHLASSNILRTYSAAQQNTINKYVNSTINLNLSPINRNTEILATLDHMTPNYFVKCNS
jgi:hypothetical protein